MYCRCVGDSNAQQHSSKRLQFATTNTASKVAKPMEQKPRSRANSVIGQIKWWTSNHHFNSNNNNNNNHAPSIKSFGSSVAVQKLRESKWFGPDESRIFCAVIECGFIVETREGKENGGWFGVVNCKTSKGNFYVSFSKDSIRFHARQNVTQMKTNGLIRLNYYLNWNRNRMMSVFRLNEELTKLHEKFIFTHA